MHYAIHSMLVLFDYKILLAILASAIGFLGYIPYYRDIFAGRTKPHVFSWFVWGLVTGIAFFAQIMAGGGAGAWVTGFTSALCTSIAIIALYKGENTITKID